MRLILLSVIPLLFSAVCPAQTPLVCPWFSTGSAAGTLGGPVTLSAHVDALSQGSCTFTRQSGSEAATLEIVIGKIDTHACPQGSPKLIALGNEATQCRSTNTQGQSLDVIAGRMRQVYFVVNLTKVPDAATSSALPEGKRDPYAASLLERATEEVVGNLY